MAILSIILYGSMAREEHAADSDVDLLLVTSDSRPRHANVDNVSLSFYSIDDLVNKAIAGDLFILHVLLEGRVLHDPTQAMDLVRQGFRQKSSYEAEIRAASDLAWMIVRFGQEFDARLAAKRITWCVRTILIAMSVQMGIPTFSSEGMIKIAPFLETAMLLRQKNNNIDDTSFMNLKSFINKYNFVDPCMFAEKADDYYAHFEHTCNSIALHMLLSKETKNTMAEYTS